MGCGGSTAAESRVKSAEFATLEDVLKEPDTEPINVDDFVEGYPPPRPVLDKKRHIFTSEDKTKADQRAAEVRIEDYSTFEELARDLTQGLKNDVQKVRSLFTWIGLQGSKKFPQNAEPMSPMHVTQMVMQRQVSYNTLFIKLCRAAKIPCVFLRGLGKSVAYEVGDREVDNLRNSWTSVYISGGWRFIFPLWAFSALVGHSTGAWTLVESEGKGTRETKEESKGLTVSNFNDYYFLTDPDEFIYYCFPNDPKWQLLNKPFTKKQFIEIANCEQGYFENNIQITSKLECLYTSEGGVCDIGMKKANGEEFKHIYKLYFNNKKSKTTLSSEIQLERYVAVMNDNSNVNFRIRFPAEGIYKMEIYGFATTFQLLCSFRLDCNEDISDVRPFPCNPESGFGPNHMTSEAGLEADSHKKGFINIRKSKNINIRFSLTRNVVVQTVLVHNQITREELSQHVHHTVRGNHLDVNVDVPKQGEYALQINTKDKGSTEPFKNACNYLLSSEDIDKKRKRTYENAAEKRARQRLDDCLNSNDPEEIQKAVEKFDEYDLDDHGKRRKAERKKTYLILHKELKDAIDTRNVERLEKALDNARSSEFVSKLQSLIDKAEELLENLRKLKRFAHEVLQMKGSTISEIHNYKHPKPLAYDIMKATYILLGEKEKALEEWEQIQSLMRKTGKGGLLRRVREFDTINVDENMVNEAAQLLRPYDADSACTASAGIGTFYNWAHKITTEMS